MEVSKKILSSFFEPESLAVIGSLREGFFGGRVVIQTLLDAGFKGKVYPIHPSYKEILGRKVYSSIKDVSEKVDLALIITGNQAVADLLRECAGKGVKAAIVVSDGFAERDEKGAIISYTGAVGVLATDEGATYGLTIPSLSPLTASKLHAIFPGLGTTIVDIGPLMVVARDSDTFYQEILSTVLEDDHVDCLFNVLWAGPMKGSSEIYLKTYEALRRNSPKPVATWIYGPRSPLISTLAQRLEDLGFPVFSDLEMAVKALGMAWQYARRKKERE